MALEHIKNWAQRAKCKDLDKKGEEIFFPDTRSPAGFKKLKSGKEFCTDCPVISQCKIYAIAHGVYGIWGGTSKSERDNLSPLAREAIRTMYIEAGQLEPLTYHTQPKQQQEQSEEQDGPIVSLENELDPTLSPLIPEEVSYIQQSM